VNGNGETWLFESWNILIGVPKTNKAHGVHKMTVFWKHGEKSPWCVRLDKFQCIYIVMCIYGKSMIIVFYSTVQWLSCVCAFFLWLDCFYSSQIKEINKNESNLTHQGTMEMWRILQDVGILRFYFSQQKYFGTIDFCRMSEDVGLLRDHNT
jgi:hypothetical protein